MACYPNVNIANKYARDIVAKKIPSCRWVQLACQRHLDDLKKAKTKSFHYRFDKDEAERFCRFIQKLPHTKDKWAQQKLKLTLEPWQIFRFCCVFGWLRKGTRNRRFTEAYNEVPRKSGKSLESAGVALYMVAADGVYGAEVYCGATTEAQAWKVFEPARIMCNRTPDLVSRFGIKVNARNINLRADNSKLEPLIGDPGDGGSPSCAIIDEYHEHRTASLYETMVTGMGARENPLTWIITTGGNNTASPCYTKRKEVEKVLEGVIKDEELFGIIYTIDPDDDWTDPKSLIKANPNYGVSISADYLLAQLQRAKNNPRQAAAYKTKYLNIWGGAREAFFNMEDWDRCLDPEIQSKDLAGTTKYHGLDLAAKLDLTADVKVSSEVADDGRVHYYCIAPKFWIPEDTVFRSDDESASQRYKQWVEEGFLDPTDGAEIDYLYILSEIKADAERGEIEGIAVDPHGAAMVSHRLMDEGLDVISITQNFTNMSDPMKELEAALKSGRFHHDGNPILKWCISNVVGKTLAGSDDIVRPIKETSGNAKIDGAVALMMAIGRIMLQEDTSSNYDNPDYGI